MTIIEASNKLYKWFSENDTFSLSDPLDLKIDKDFLSFFVLSEDEEKDLAVLLLALDNYEESGIIKRKKINNRNYYFLVKPFSSYTQNVTVSATTANAVSILINAMCDSIGDHTDACDATNITDNDIRNLVYVCNQALKPKDEK